MNKLFRLLIISLLSFNILGYLNAGCGCDVIIEATPESKCVRSEKHHKKHHHKKHRRHHCKKHIHCKHKHIHHKECC